MKRAPVVVAGPVRVLGALGALWWLSAAAMLAACWLPWVLLRPNRLAQGSYQHLPPGGVALGLLLCAITVLALRFAPKVLGLLASLAVGLGLWGLSALTSAAVVEQESSARASASSGVWLWLLGAFVSVYAAQLLASRLPGRRVWKGWAWLWVPVVAWLVLGGHFANWSVARELDVQRSRFVQELGQHLKLVVSGLGLAALIGVPTAVWASRRARVADVVLGVAGGVQTVPSLALLGLLIAPLSALAAAVPALRALGMSGIGTAPALCAMTLYALLPIVRNGIVALRGVHAGVLDAARGMGMTDNQRFWRVQLPLALPVWLSGVRQAAVLLVGVASVAQLIGAGGLGYFIFSGLQSGASDLILLGALPAAALAIGVDGLLRALERLLSRQLGSASESRERPL